MSVYEHISGHQPSGIAIEANGILWSYGDITGKVNGLLEHFTAVQQRQCIAYDGKSIPEFIVVMLFALKKKWPLIVFPAGELFLQQVLSETSPIVLKEGLVIQDATHVSSAASLDEKAAVIIYTSGTTGKPVGIVASEQSFVINVQELQQSLPLQDIERFMVCTSIFTSYGLSLGIMLPLLLGKTIQLIDFNHPKITAAETSAKCMITNPSVLSKLIEYPEAIVQLKEKGLSLIISSGAFLPADCFKVLHDQLQLPVADSYGTSETNGIGLKINSYENPVLPLPSVKTRLEPVDEGSYYKLLVSSPKNMLGYLHPVAGTAVKMQNGWVQTADVVSAAGEGFIIAGRLSSLVKVNGHRVQVETVEHAVEELEEVQEALVFGDSHETMGEILCAKIVLRRTTTININSLVSRLAVRLPSHMIPKKIEVVEMIEKNNGKKIRKDLVCF